MMNESISSIYEIIAMTIAAMSGNCDGWDEIEDFCQIRAHGESIGRLRTASIIA